MYVYRKRWSMRCYTVHAQYVLTTVIGKPDRFHIQWWTDIKNVRITTLQQVR